MPFNKIKARLALENGTIFSGYGFGAISENSEGEVVFNTSITGYQEILTDPSYTGQIVTMTYPHIGNVGVNQFDVESHKMYASGMIVKEISRIRSNWRSEFSIQEYFEKYNVLGIEGIDTRMLTKILRSEGSMRGIITCSSISDEELIFNTKQVRDMNGLDLVSEVSCKKIFSFETKDKSGYKIDNLKGFVPLKKFKVIVLDFGVKFNILERLSNYGCDLIIVPSNTSSSDILELNPDGIFLSNGPGDPDAVKYAIETIKELIGKKPIFGICLGHQLISLALGGRTFKMKFGHRGSNHPVQNLKNNTNEITSQNHGFAVDINSLDNLKVDITHINLNDMTVEGLRHIEKKLFCVQYHPEAGPGPHDSDYLFKEFIELMNN